MKKENQMRGQESEAYEIDANTRKNLENLGFAFTEAAGGSQVYQSTDNKDIRVLVTPGALMHSIIDYGRVSLQRHDGAGWQEVQQVSKAGFAEGSERLAIPAPNSGPQ